MCLDHMRRAPERTCRWRRTLPYPEPSRPSAAFFPCRPLADCTIITSGCDLRHGQAFDGRPETIGDAVDDMSIVLGPAIREVLTEKILSSPFAGQFAGPRFIFK